MTNGNARAIYLPQMRRALLRVDLRAAARWIVLEGRGGMPRSAWRWVQIGGAERSVADCGEALRSRNVAIVRGRYLENPQREDNTGVKLSRADFAINLIASGSPDLTPAVRRCSTLLAAGFCIGIAVMTKGEFEAYKASQIAALLEWDRKRQQVAK